MDAVRHDRVHGLLPRPILKLLPHGVRRTKEQEEQERIGGQQAFVQKHKHTNRIKLILASYNLFSRLCVVTLSFCDHYSLPDFKFISFQSKEVPLPLLTIIPMN